MKKFLKKHFLMTLSLLNMLIIAFGMMLCADVEGRQYGEKSYLIGSALSIINFFLLVLLWKFVFQKKNIALLVVAIVSKYATLAGFIMYALSLVWLNKSNFVVGVLTNPLSILICGIFYGLIPEVKEEKCHSTGHN